MDVVDQPILLGTKGILLMTRTSSALSGSTPLRHAWDPLASLAKTTATAVVGAAMMTLAIDTSCVAAADRYVRVNQLGYRSSDFKIARLLSKTNRQGASVQLVRTSDSIVVWSGFAGASGGNWGTFGFVHPVDLSSFATAGTYRLRLPATGEESIAFTIGNGGGLGIDYEHLGTALSGFFGYQRCGNTNPVLHDACHLLDAHHIVGGPDDGDPVDAVGGWHDAGDYIKFLSTEAISTQFLLWADEIHPGLAGDTDENGRSDLLDEAVIGVRHLLKYRYQPNRFLYQIQDSDDHSEGWRMPEDDDLTANRPAFYGAGKNQLGRLAAALARASVSLRSTAPGLADSALFAAQNAYASAATAPNLTNGEFYGDATWQDKMGLGAIELYLATDDPFYLAEAKSWSDQAGPGYWLSWDTMNGWLNALLAPYYAPALDRLREDLDNFASQSASHPFAMTATETWGINTVLTGVAALALLHERITGDHDYAALAYAQRDFVLGTNPWGVCFVGGLGSTSPQDFHHQVAVLANGGALYGCLTEGPAPLSVIQENGIVLEDPDEYAEFQATRGVYHDDRNDYVTNEPTLVQNATAVLMTALFASRGLAPAATPDPRANVLNAWTLEVWPNPARSFVEIKLTPPLSSAAKARLSSPGAHVDVMDVAGRRVARLMLRSDPVYGLAAEWTPATDGAFAPAGSYWVVADGAEPRRLTILR